MKRRSETTTQKLQRFQEILQTWRQLPGWFAGVSDDVPEKLKEIHESIPLQVVKELVKSFYEQEYGVQVEFVHGNLSELLLEVLRRRFSVIVWLQENMEPSFSKGWWKEHRNVLICLFHGDYEFGSKRLTELCAGDVSVDGERHITYRNMKTARPLIDEVAALEFSFFLRSMHPDGPLLLKKKGSDTPLSKSGIEKILRERKKLLRTERDDQQAASLVRKDATDE